MPSLLPIPSLFSIPRQALLCILADNCDEPMYKKLVTALCQVKHLLWVSFSNGPKVNCCSVAQEHGIPLIKVDSNMKLGEWAGLCKIDQEGKARKVVKCSAAVVGIIISLGSLLVLFLCHRLYVKLLTFPDLGPRLG